MGLFFTSSRRQFLPISSRFAAFHRGIMDSGMTMHVSRHPSNEWKNDALVFFQPRANRMSTYPTPAHQRKPFSLILPRSSRNSSMYNNNHHHTIGGIEMEESTTHESSYEILRPGMLLLKNYLTISQQVEIVNRCQELGIGPGGFYEPYPGGAKLRRLLMCLGRNWEPQTKYNERFRSNDGSEAPPIPDELVRMVKDVLQHSESLHQLPSMSPDICLVNFYTTSGRLALHQDRDESSYSLRVGLPVVSISIGDSADFLYGVSRDVDNASKTLLESGDVLIFGGKSRLIYHGVTTIIPNSAPRPLLQQTMLRPGRLNLTFREF